MTTHSLLRLVLTLAAAAVASGCASMRPLHSTPPVSGFALTNAVELTYLFGSKTILPAGHYRPVFEDNVGYYYEAPAKIIGNNSAVWLWEGGLFIPKGADVPDRYYTIGRNNVVSLHKLRRELVVEKNP